MRPLGCELRGECALGAMAHVLVAACSAYAGVICVDVINLAYRYAHIHGVRCRYGA